MAYSLLGWERFFEELAAFIRTCDRQSGTANQSFSEYALERIQTSILSLSSLVHHIDHASPNSDAESAVFEDYLTKLTELLSCRRELSHLCVVHSILPASMGQATALLRMFRNSCLNSG